MPSSFVIIIHDFTPVVKGFLKIVSENPSLLRWEGRIFCGRSQETVVPFAARGRITVACTRSSISAMADSSGGTASTRLAYC